MKKKTEDILDFFIIFFIFLLFLFVLGFLAIKADEGMYESCSPKIVNVDSSCIENTGLFGACGQYITKYYFEDGTELLKTDSKGWVENNRFCERKHK